MDARGVRALALARAQGYFIAFVVDFGAVRVRGCCLEVGPMASPDLIATLACRTELERADFAADEADLVDLVISRGFDYEPEPWRAFEA
jgi:hypothetical protein